MNHYKSWSGLNKQLNTFLCEDLKGRIDYFLTRYHEVHNSYGRAAIRLDGIEIAGFTWMDGYRQEADINEMWKENGIWDFENSELKEKWNENGIYSEGDFLKAAVDFINMPLKEALISDNYIIRIFAIMDRRLGKKTCMDIAQGGEYKSYPAWVRQFYELRLGEEKYLKKETDGDGNQIM